MSNTCGPGYMATPASHRAGETRGTQRASSSPAHGVHGVEIPGTDTLSDVLADWRRHGEQPADHEPEGAGTRAMTSADGNRMKRVPCGPISRAPTGVILTPPPPPAPCASASASSVGPSPGACFRVRPGPAFSTACTKTVGDLRDGERPSCRRNAPAHRRHAGCSGCARGVGRLASNGAGLDIQTSIECSCVCSPSHTPYRKPLTRTWNVHASHACRTQVAR